MAQTDRQTDKATHWKSAIFNVEDNWSRLDTIPSFVDKVYRQKEICPTTGNEHFQLHAVCKKQVRLSQMCGWIKHTKWIPVLGKEHIENSIKYTSKSDTAVPGTHEVLHGQRYIQLHEMLYLLASYVDPMDDNGFSWEYVTRSMIRSKGIEWATKLSVQGLKNAWVWWGSVFYEKYTSDVEESGGVSIIEDPAPTQVYEFLQE